MRPSLQRERSSRAGAAWRLSPWLLVLLLALFSTGCVVNPVPTPGEANSFNGTSPFSDASSGVDGNANAADASSGVDGSANAADTPSTESDIGESDAGTDDASVADDAGVGTEPDVMTEDGQSGDL